MRETREAPDPVLWMKPTEIIGNKKTSEHFQGKTEPAAVDPGGEKNVLKPDAENASNKINKSFQNIKSVRKSDAAAAGRVFRTELKGY